MTMPFCRFIQRRRTSFATCAIVDSEPEGTCSLILRESMVHPGTSARFATSDSATVLPCTVIKKPFIRWRALDWFSDLESLLVGFYELLLNLFSVLSVCLHPFDQFWCYLVYITYFSCVSLIRSILVQYAFSLSCFSQYLGAVIFSVVWLTSICLVLCVVGKYTISMCELIAVVENASIKASPL